MSAERALSLAAPTEGWLTEGQARRLWERANALPGGARIVEIGSFRGRSTIVLALASPPGAEVVAIDPHAGSDRGPREIRGDPALGAADLQAFRANLERAGVAERVRHVRRPSQAALEEVQGAVDLLYVDGAHRYGPARADLALWGSRVRPGGVLLVHDAFSSVGVTLALTRLLLAGREFRYTGRVGSLAEYRREPLRGRARARNAVRQLRELGWFARNLAVKLLIVARLRSGPWPY